MLRFAVDSLFYCCAPMNRRAFTLRPSVIILTILQEPYYLLEMPIVVTEGKFPNSNPGGLPASTGQEAGYASKEASAAHAAEDGLEVLLPDEDVGF